MNIYKLEKLTIDDGKDVFNMLKRIGDQENDFKNPVHNMNFKEFKSWLIEQDNWSKNIGVPKGFVPQSVFWFYENGCPVGIGKLRHELTEQSRNIGGNIGYAIDPLYRGKGLGTKLLMYLLYKAKEMNIRELLLTVEKYNNASKRIIENNGGVLIKENQNRWFFRFE